MSGEIIRGVLNEQTLIFTVGKNEFDAIPSSPPFFFFLRWKLNVSSS